MIRRIAVRGVVLVAVLCAGAPMALALSRGAPPAGAVTHGEITIAPRHSLLRSRELWATIDVCNPAKEPDTVGIRGSMPGDGHEKDTMYMRFQLQYREAKSSVWTDLHGGDSGYVGIGDSKIARQGGWSVQLTPSKSQPTYTMRGVVTFQWRQGSRVLHAATRTTSASHPNVLKADPPGYSAAQCTLP